MALIELEMVYAQSQIDSIIDNPDYFDDEQYLCDDHVCLGCIYQNRGDHFRVCNQLCHLKPEHIDNLKMHETSYNDAECRL